MLFQNWNVLFLAIIFLLTVSSFCDSVYNFGGNIGANEPIVNFNYTIPVTSAIACIFSIQSAQFSNVIMVVNTTPINLTLDRQSLSAMYLAQSQFLKYMDLPSTIGNRPQLVNLPVPANSTNVTVYLAFYNLDLPTLQTAKVYSLSIRSYDKSGLACFSCPSGTSFRNPNSCKCSPCAADYYGDTCQYEVSTMSEGKKYNSNLYSMANSYYRIVNPPDTISISYSESRLTHKINLYIQFQLAPGDLAGQINTYYSQLGLAYSKLLTTAENSFTFPTHGRNVAITLHSNENTPPTTATIQYHDAKSQERLALILGLTLGLTLPLILLVVCCLYKKLTKKRHLPANSFFLQKRQLNFYFPQVMASTVFAFESKEVEDSLEQLNESKDENSGRREEEGGEERTCVVCLSPIESKSKIRVTYCRHIFHSHCLLGWFKKNENCPFCRHDCSINPTQAAYQQLKGHKRQFRKRDLVAAIIQQNPSTYHQISSFNKEATAEEPEQTIQYEIEDSREYEPTGLVAPSSRKKHRREMKGSGRKGELGKGLQRKIEGDEIEE